jgi:hypothetical protein
MCFANEKVLTHHHIHDSVREDEKPAPKEHKMAKKKCLAPKMSDGSLSNKENVCAST